MKIEGGRGENRRTSSKKPSAGGCNAYVGASGAAVRGQMQFHSRILIKKKGATDNGNAAGSRRGAAGEPPGITLSGSMAPGMLLIKIN